MKTAALIAVAILALGTMLWAEDEAVVAPQPTANPQSTICRPKSLAALSIPQVVSYQGRLTDATGVPVRDGEYIVAFRLYAQPSGGSPFWSETQKVTTRDGLFAVLLGSVTPIGAKGKGPEAAYLGMAVEGSEEMMPRLRLANGYTIPNDRAGVNDNKGGGTDDDDEWVHSDSVLFTIRRLGIAKGGVSNNLYGSGATRSTHVNLGVASTTGENRYEREYAVVLGGYQNTASRGYATVAGGTENVANGPSATVVGGYQNTASGWRSTICGGYSNVTAGVHSAVPGGWSNRAADSSGFAAGTHAKATHKYSAVIGLRQADSTFSIGVNSFTVGAESSYLRRRVQVDTVVASQAYKGAVLSDSQYVTKGYVDAQSGGGNDSDWVRGGDSVLYTVHQLGLVRGGDNTVRGTDPYTYVNFGVGCTTGTASLQTTGITVCGGVRHYAAREYSTVAGGFYNKAGARYAFIGGGDNNDATGDGAVIAGGHDNTASGYGSFVGGGGVIGLWPSGNTASGNYAAIVGGTHNQATANYAFVGSGDYDSARAAYSAVVSGWSNRAAATAAETAAAVVGGRNNQALGKYSFVGGGKDNIASAYGATVAGGERDSAGGYYSAVGGGLRNSADSMCAFVGGGADNIASDDYAVVVGGYDNAASGPASTVAGGRLNTASGSRAAIGGGYDNTASGTYPTVGGGYTNTASGDYSTVAGGLSCDALASYSFAVGSGSTVSSGHTNSAALNGQTTTASGQTRVGALSKASGTFTIDHPLDPSGKILNHYFVESPDMSNVYSGSVVLNAVGRGEVKLPDYFDALNRNPRVQLTGVGTSDVYVVEKPAGNRFVVGGKPGVEVYWQVTGDRKDPSAEITRIIMPVEQPKTGALAGHSLDDEFLSGCMDQLVREGKAQGIDFRTPAGRQRYEQTRPMAEEHGGGR